LEENKQKLKETLAKLEISPHKIDTIILTHAHYDHVQNIDLFPNAKIYGNFTKIINPDHTQTVKKRILPISECPLTKLPNFQFIPAPGHTPGDILILYKNVLFSGDVIFHGGYIGRNDFPESNPEEQKKSLQMLSKLKFDILCPGH
jgi:glyoxylase-like metal-dependent hydrolase (beta-lactamase superfamily II)